MNLHYANQPLVSKEIRSADHESERIQMSQRHFKGIANSLNQILHVASENVGA